MLIMDTAVAPDSVIIFALGDVRFALSTTVVERVVRAVEVSPLADAPPGIIGVINVHGWIIPVLDIRPRFGLPQREVDVNDHMVIAHAGDRRVAVLVDAPVDVVAAGSATVAISMETLARVGGGVEGVMMQGDDIVAIQDLARLLPPEPGKNPPLKLAA
jgi:purine-binding chemotaxis protein CheW